VAASILTTAYHMLAHGTCYQDLGIRPTARLWVQVYPIATIHWNDVQWTRRKTRVCAFSHSQ